MTREQIDAWHAERQPCIDQMMAIMDRVDSRWPKFRRRFTERDRDEWMAVRQRIDRIDADRGRV